MNYDKIINANEQGKEGSFVGILHEEQLWNEQLFFDLYDAIIVATLSKSPEEMYIAINKINAFILNSVIHHLRSEDQYLIKNFQNIDIQSYLERLNVVVEAFFQKKKINEEFFNDDLRK